MLCMCIEYDSIVMDVDDSCQNMFTDLDCPGCISLQEVISYSHYFVCTARLLTTHA